VVAIVSAVPEPPLEPLPLPLLDDELLLPAPDDDELLLELLEEDELPPLEDEPLPLELELEPELELAVVTESPSLLLPLPQAATARHEIATSKVSGSVGWRM
jgi:hypothetical protein